ncbi:MAG TPA: hypothetical protein ENG66_02535 [Thermococcus sp.]|nr:MAG: hypothetical protein DRN63_04595 [Nanoarchaeota archaeon]HDH44268.1 hypothetical protein [Thermococcus sp.]
MRIEELLEALKNVMGWDRCIEFKYFPRRNEVVAKVDLEKSMSDGELLAISGILKDLGFSGFWIDSGECDILEDRYIAPEIEFRAKDIDPELIKFLRRHGDSYIVCKR